VRVLVTGGCGFVGGHVVEALRSNADDVIVVDKAHPVTPVDLCDIGPGLLEGIQAIVHCAAYADLRHNWESLDEREAQWTDNVRATIALLEHMPPVPLIFTSSASVYGSQCVGRTTPVTEEDAHPDTCESPYAASKLACEAIIASYAYFKGFPYYNLRLVNQVGSGSHRGVIADFVRMAKLDGFVHAADDGSQEKSWVHVEDTAEAIVSLLQQVHNVPSGTYNMTSADRVSWWRIVEIMRETHDFEVTHEPRRKGAVGDPEDITVSGEKMATFYKPWRNVNDGIRDALRSLGWP